MVSCSGDGNLIMNIEEEHPADAKRVIQDNQNTKECANDSPKIILDSALFAKNWCSGANLLENLTDSNDNNLVRVIEEFGNRRILEINLQDAGIMDTVMDRLRPRIIVREQCRCPAESQATFALTVRLLKEHESIDLRNYPVKRVGMSTMYWHKGENKGWQTCEVILNRYPVGIRRIVIESESRMWNRSKENVVFEDTKVFLDFEKKERQLEPLAAPTEKPMIFFV